MRRYAAARSVPVNDSRIQREQKNPKTPTSARKGISNLYLLFIIQQWCDIKGEEVRQPPECGLTFAVCGGKAVRHDQPVRAMRGAYVCTQLGAVAAVEKL